MAPKGIKYFRINLTKEVKDLYIENYTAKMKEIKTQMKMYSMERFNIV
jgi:hypothetical protein